MAIETFLEGMANVNAQDLAGFTPLMWAAGRNATESVKMLLDYEADMNLKANRGQTAMTFALTNGCSAIVDILERHQMLLDREEAKSSIQDFVSGLNLAQGSYGRPENANLQVQRVTPVLKLNKPVELRSKNPRPGDSNDAIVHTIIDGVATLKGRVVLGLLGQILAQEAYNDLRTSRQLGYVVQAGASQASNVQYLTTLVQGNSLRADEVEAAIENLLTNVMPRKLPQLTTAEFAAYRDSYRQGLIKPPQNFLEEAAHFSAPVLQGGQCFDLSANLVATLDELVTSKQILIDKWASLVHPAKGLRNKVVVKHFADKVPPRPTAEEVASLWSKEGLQGDALSLLHREFLHTRVLDHVDSTVRQRLVEESGTYPLDLHCEPEYTQQAPSLLQAHSLAAKAARDAP